MVCFRFHSSRPRFPAVACVAALLASDSPAPTTATKVTPTRPESAEKVSGTSKSSHGKHFSEVLSRENLEHVVLSGSVDEKKAIIDWIHENLIPRSNFTLPYMGPAGPKNPLGLPYGLIPPVVISHGISSSCYEMQRIELESFLRNYLNTYVACISTGGDTQVQQYVASWFYGFKSSIDLWHKKVQEDPELKDGFIALGFSQGNGILRGYVQQYNDPPVKTWMAFHGVLGGEGAVPGLDPLSAALRDVYRPIANLAGTLCHSALLVNRITPCGYFRNPIQISEPTYRLNSEMARMNGEDRDDEPVHKVPSNFNTTGQFVFVKGLEDNIILPRDAEWWAFYGVNYNSIYTMPHQAWYMNNTFGLRTVVEAGKVHFRTTPRGHMDVTQDEMRVFLNDYIVPKEYRPKGTRGVKPISVTAAGELEIPVYRDPEEAPIPEPDGAGEVAAPVAAQEKDVVYV